MNTMLENFHFIRPFWLLALLPAIIIFVGVLKTRNQANEWHSVISPHLLPFLIEGNNSPVSRLPFYALLIIWFLSIFALAGPTWEKISQPLKKDSSALVVLFDLSPSMNVKDVTPSRLVRARLKLIDLLDTRKEGLTALIAYAGEAHVVTPLTDDVDTIENLIPSLSPETMPIPGSNPEMALAQANTLLKDAGIEHGNILFITDGIAKSAQKELKKYYQEYGHKISIWGFGTAEGAPIQLTEGSLARSSNGEIVIAKLDDDELNEAAMAMNAVYIPFTNTQSDIESINNYGLNTLGKQQREVEREFDQWQEFGPWLIIICLPFIALSFRRGLILSCFCLLAVYQPPLAEAQTLSPDNQSQAAANNSPAIENVAPSTTKKEHAPSKMHSGGVWKNLWLTPDQQAQKALEAGNAEEAAALFSAPERKGTANFRANKFKEAAEFFKQSEPDPEALFNEATALTHAGNYDDAIATFDKALQLQPYFPKAATNKSIAEKLKALEEQQKQDQQQNQDQKKNQDQKNQNQDSKNQNQQNADQQQDQEQSDQQQSQQEQSQQSQDQQSQDQQNADKQNGQQESDQQNDSQQQAQDASQNDVDEEKAKQDYEKQMTRAQQQNAEKEDDSEKSEEMQAEQSDEQKEKATQQQQAFVESDEEGMTEEQQKLEHLLRKVPDDPGRLLRNKFRYETQQRQLEADSSKWNTPENSEEERW